MNTLHDLRSTLDQHAEGLHDGERYARPVAVRARIRAVRRRRAGAVAVAAAALVVAGVAGFGALRGPSVVEPAGPTVLGLEVPETWMIDEFPYELDRTATFSGDRDRIELVGDGDGPARAVALYADGLGSGSATLFSDGEAIARVIGDEDAELPVPVSNPGATLSVRLTGVPAGARAGVAVYTATDELAEGVGNGTAVFRQVVAGSELLAAGFSDETRPEVRFTFHGRLARAAFASYCASAENGLRLNLEIDGDGAVSGRCQRQDARDAGTSRYTFPDETGPARDHTVRAYLTRGDADEPVSSPDTAFGAAVYRRLVAQQSVAGTWVESVIEHAGRAWRLARVIDGASARIPARDSDLLLGFVAQGEMTSVRWAGTLVDGQSTYAGGPDVGVATAGLLLRGDTYDVRLTADEGELTRGALLVYRPE